MAASVTLATGTPVIFIDRPPGCVVLGTDPWGDNDDATLTESWGRGSNIVGTLANLTDTRTPTDVVFRSRVSANGPISLSSLMIQDFDTGEQIMYFANGLLSPDGLIHDTENRVSDIDPDNLAYYVGWLRDATGLTISHGNDGSTGTYFRVYAATVTVEFGSTVAPPCHLYPRDDDQGVGSGAIWPPPSSGRPGGYY